MLNKKFLQIDIKLIAMDKEFKFRNIDGLRFQDIIKRKINFVNF
jgi:hypothetical protein